MMRVVSRWNRWKKCHSKKNWVMQNWRVDCVMVDGELIPETRGSILEGTVCYSQRR